MTLRLRFLTYKDHFWLLGPTCCCCSFVSATAAIIVNFDCADFVALTVGIDVAAVHASPFNFVPAVNEIVVDDENDDDDDDDDADLR